MDKKETTEGTACDVFYHAVPLLQTRINSELILLVL